MRMMSDSASPRGRPRRPVSTAASTTSSGSAGSASSPSARRISTASVQPPAQAASRPIAVPSPVAPSATREGRP